MSQMPSLITIDESIDISDITETLDEIIMNVIKTLRKNHKRPDECSIYDLIAKSLGNIKLTKDHIEERLRIMILSGTLENKEHNGKNSFFIKEKINLEDSVTSIKGESQIHENHKSSILEDQENQNDTLNEEIKRLDTELTRMNSFFVEQLCALKQLIKDIKPPNDRTTSENSIYIKTLTDEIT